MNYSPPGIPPISARSCTGGRKNFYQVRISDINAEIVPANTECPPGPYKCYLDISIHSVRKRTRVSRRGKYTWGDTFEFSVREDWPICIQLLAKRTFFKDVLLASSGDWIKLPILTQTKAVSHVLRCVQEENGVSDIYQASVSWTLGLLDPHPMPDLSSPAYSEDTFIEEVGELITAPNPSRVELRSFSGKALPHPTMDFDCCSSSDDSSFMLSLHDLEGSSISSKGSSSFDHNEVLISPVSDLPQGDGFPPNPRDMGNTDRYSVQEATLIDHTPKDNLDGGELPKISQSLVANTMNSLTSIAKDSSQATPELSMRSLSSRANQTLSWRACRHAHRGFWRRVKLLFSLPKSRNAHGETHS